MKENVSSENTEQIEEGKKTTPFIVKLILIVLIILTVLVLAYFLYGKEKVVEISSEKLSELLNMDVNFDSYEFISGNNLEISGMSIVTPYPQADYKKHNKYHTDWLSIKIRKIRLDNFDYQRLIEGKQFYASSVTIDSAEIDIYRDKTLPDPPFKHKPLWGSLLAKISTELNVDTLYLKNSNVRYFEKSVHSDNAGRVHFANTFATCYGISNNAKKLKDQPILEIDMQGDVMGISQIIAKALIDLSSKNDAFTLSAKADGFEAIHMNRILSGVLPVTITEGQVKGIKVEMSANENNATGTVELEYEGMKFDLFSGDEHSKLKSFFANAAAKAIIHKENLKTNKNFRVGVIKFDRNKDRSIFNYWWKATQTGVVDAMMTDAGKLFKLDEKAKKVK